MKAVNLIPRDSRSRGGLAPAMAKAGVGHLLIAVLVVALGVVTFYVFTNNTVNSRKAQVASLQQQLTRMQAAVNRLDSYQRFEKLALARAATVRQIAGTRFDWYSALSDLSKVIPGNTTLQSLSATVAPNVSAGGGGGASGLRGAINAPALELTGCTGTQDEVAQLMSRLRVVSGVARVSLQSSTAAGGGGSAPGACSAGGPTFDMVVFFTPQAGSTGGAATAGGVK